MRATETLSVRAGALIPATATQPAFAQGHAFGRAGNAAYSNGYEDGYRDAYRAGYEDGRSNRRFNDHYGQPPQPVAHDEREDRWRQRYARTYTYNDDSFYQECRQSVDPAGVVAGALIGGLLGNAVGR